MKYKSYRNTEPVGVVIRAIANILDSFLISLPIVLVWLFVIGFDTDMFEKTTFVPDLIYGFYGILIPIIWYGFTVGKKMMGIRIVKINGEVPGIGTMLMRNVVASFVYLITFGIGYIVSAFMVGFREDKRSIHDFIAGTMVVGAVESTLENETDRLFTDNKKDGSMALIEDNEEVIVDTIKEQPEQSSEELNVSNIETEDKK